MHNWYFLLLALLAVFQPIASFTERNLVNGRQQCSDRPSLLQDSRLSLYGSNSKLYPEERRLKYRDTREVRRESRRYDVKDGNSLFTPAERRLVENRAQEDILLTPEKRVQYSRVQHQRTREGREAPIKSLSSYRVLVQNREKDRVWSRDPNIKGREDRREKNTKNLSDAILQEHGSRILIDARSRASFNPIRDEIAGVESPENRQMNRMTDHRISYREGPEHKQRERQSLDRLSGGTERHSRFNVRQSRRNDIRGFMGEDYRWSVDSRRAVFDRREVRDRSSSNMDELQQAYRVRSVSRDADRRQTLSLERIIDNREELRAASGTSRKGNEKESRSKNVDLRTVRAKRSDQQGYTYMLNEPLLFRDNDNIRTETNRISRNIAEARQVDLRGNKRDLQERREFRSDERLDMLRGSKVDLNRRSRSSSFESRRVYPRITDNVRDTVIRVRQTQNRFDTSRDRENKGIVQITRFEYRREDSARNSDSERRERTSNIRLNGDIRRVRTHRETSKSQVSRLVNVENMRIETRSFNERKVRDNIRDHGLNNFRGDVIDSRTISPSDIRLVKNEARRGVLFIKNERSRDTIRRVQRFSINRVERIRATDNSNQNKRLESRNIQLERDTIDLAGNRVSWKLGSEKEQIITPQYFTMNWQYLFYILQGIYLSAMLMQVLGGSNTKNTRSQHFWMPTQKLLKID